MSNSNQIFEFCRKARFSKFIAIDTEFVNKNHYLSDLCLIQLATEREAILIDPFVSNRNLNPLIRLLESDIIKIFHDFRQDLPLLKNYLGIPLKNIFDTYIVASVLDLPSKSFAGLVELFLAVQLDKSKQQSNWSRRPLTNNQIKYAYNDVIWLIQLYKKMIKDPRYIHNEHQIECQAKAMVEKYNRAKNPKTIWKNIRFPNLRIKEEIFGDPNKLARFKYILQKREEISIKYNILPSYLCPFKYLLEWIKNDIPFDLIEKFIDQRIFQLNFI